MLWKLVALIMDFRDSGPSGGASIPPLKRDLIDALGYGGRVTDLVKGGAMPAAIVRELEADPVFVEKMHGVGAQKLFPSDVHAYLAKELQRSQALVASGNPDAAAVAIQAAKERILSNLQLLGNFEALAQRTLLILQADLDRYEVELHEAEVHNKELPWDAKGRRPLPEYPFQQAESTRKAVTTIMESIRTLRGDSQLQGILKAQTVNVNKGISQKELHEILFSVGRKLGHTEEAVTKAYTKHIMERRDRRSDAVDVPIRPMPPIVQAVEKRLGYDADPAPAVPAP